MKSGNQIKKQLNRIVDLGLSYHSANSNDWVKRAIHIADRYIMNLKRHFAWDNHLSMISEVKWNVKRRIKVSSEIYAK